MGNYLVTGVAGFIGSAIVRALLRRGDNVRGLDDFSTGKRENIAELKGDLDFREVSLLDSDGLAAACAGVDCLFHQAAVAFVPKPAAEPQLTQPVNIEGAPHLLRAA